MRQATAAQLANATFANVGQKVWSVVGKWSATEQTRTLARGMNYREAKATARSIREACGFANVVKA
jgi:hypothetical protein